MYKSILLALTLLMTVCTNGMAETIEKWNKSEVKGYTRYWTTNNVGANFVVWCHPDRTINGTLISIQIDGKTPPPNTRVKLVIDRDLMEVPVNEQGYIQTDCAYCSDSFGYIWHKLRSSSAVGVKFNDERYAGFSLKGAKTILPSAVCPTDWQKKHGS